MLVSPSATQFFDGPPLEKLVPSGGSALHEVFSESGEAKSVGVISSAYVAHLNPLFAIAYLRVSRQRCPKF